MLSICESFILPSMESKHEFIQLSISNYNRQMHTKTFHKKLTCAAAHIVHTLIRLGYVTKDELLGVPHPHKQ